jgi:hypothetical protein
VFLTKISALEGVATSLKWNPGQSLPLLGSSAVNASVKRQPRVPASDFPRTITRRRELVLDRMPILRYGILSSRHLAGALTRQSSIKAPLRSEAFLKMDGKLASPH